MFESLTEGIGALQKHVNALETLLLGFPNMAFIIFDAEHNNIFSGGELLKDESLKEINALTTNPSVELKLLYDRCLCGEKIFERNLTLIPVYNGKKLPAFGMLLLKDFNGPRTSNT